MSLKVFKERKYLGLTIFFDLKNLNGKKFKPVGEKTFYGYGFPNLCPDDVDFTHAQTS